MNHARQIIAALRELSGFLVSMRMGQFVCFVALPASGRMLLWEISDADLLQCCRRGLGSWGASMTEDRVSEVHQDTEESGPGPVIRADENAARRVWAARQELLTALEELGQYYPGLQFGQLLTVAAYLARGPVTPAVWDVTDSELLLVVRKQIERASACQRARELAGDR